ncbi:NAT10-like protein [Mya arenaria]|uniref:RNA cytidine acetyltransferase n=1 Tax=Mya arenaria TaxID=6604 RepID=A0ABY7E2X5_MYAAR|nr:NAT10-like protein [Mya arenaria]
MVRKKIDNRIRVLIENGVAEGHRTMFVVIGDHARDQVVILHHMLSKAQVKARPSVLWCYKKELGFSSHRKKRMRQLQKKISSGKLDVKEDDPFELFISATSIRYCYYAETHKILGNTYGMCVLQDFEALTPNLLARTIETVEGGGIITILLNSMNSLKQLYTMTMEESLSPAEQELRDLKDSLQDTQPVGALVKCCRTLDQGKALLKFVEAISEKTLRSTVAMTAARGRGKSATLGLAIATAVGFGYSNIFVTSPSPENLKTLFEFIFKGFDALEYQEHLDYEILQSTNPDFNKAIVRVNIFREHRQTIQYIHPTDANKLGQAELVCIDEAAAIPLPLVKNLLGPYLVFLSSTVNGYEGTGRSLSLKLIQQLRQQSLTFGGTTSEVKKTVAMTAKSDNTSSVSGRVLHELVLNESIRYADKDPVEKWLNGLLCLDASEVPRISSGCPLPELCDLYYVNRDTLFSYHKASEAFLHRNTPNDLQLLSDAPAHHIFVLLGPVDANQAGLPEVLCVLQVCLEGEISKSSIMNSLSRGKRASGDLIPWTVSQQVTRTYLFRIIDYYLHDHDFPSLSGARVVRIATHPDYQGMGYGKRAMGLLEQYYEGGIQDLGEGPGVEDMSSPTVGEDDVGLLEERLTPKKHLPPLLMKLNERRAEKLHYLGTTNELTGEHSCIMLKALNTGDTDSTWLPAFWKDFRRRFVSLLSYQFRAFTPAMALNVLQQKQFKEENKKSLTRSELEMYITRYDLKRLELYSQNMVDYHLIMDLVPILARMGVLLGLGLQHKTVDDLERELDLPAAQLLGLFNKVVRKLVQSLRGVLEAHVERDMVARQEFTLTPAQQTIDEELDEAAKEVKAKQREQMAALRDGELKQYTIKGSEQDWDQALHKGKKGLISVKSTLAEKRKIAEPEPEKKDHSKHKKKMKKRHKP